MKKLWDKKRSKSMYPPWIMKYHKYRWTRNGLRERKRHRTLRCKEGNQERSLQYLGEWISWNCRMRFFKGCSWRTSKEIDCFSCIMNKGWWQPTPWGLSSTLNPGWWQMCHAILIHQSWQYLFYLFFYFIFTNKVWTSHALLMAIIILIEYTFIW